MQHTAAKQEENHTSCSHSYLWRVAIHECLAPATSSASHAAWHSLNSTQVNPLFQHTNSLLKKSCPCVHSNCACSSKILTNLWIERPTVVAISQNVKSIGNLLRRIRSIKVKSRLFPIYNHLAKHKRNKFSPILCFCHHLSQDSFALLAS